MTSVGRDDHADQRSPFPRSAIIAAPSRRDHEQIGVSLGELLERRDVHQATVVDEHDAVRRRDRGQAVRHHDDCRRPRRAQGLSTRTFRADVERGRALVEHEHARLPVDGPRDRETLALPA